MLFGLQLLGRQSTAERFPVDAILSHSRLDQFPSQTIHPGMRAAQKKVTMGIGECLPDIMASEPPQPKFPAARGCPPGRKLGCNPQPIEFSLVATAKVAKNLAGGEMARPTVQGWS
jgi:hypothetical protein